MSLYAHKIRGVTLTESKICRLVVFPNGLSITMRYLHAYFFTVNLSDSYGSELSSSVCEGLAYANHKIDTMKRKLK